MHEQDEHIERRDVEQPLGAGGSAEADQLPEQVRTERSRTVGGELDPVRPPQVERHQDDQHAEIAQDRPDRRSFQAQRGKAELSVDEHVVGRDVQQHAGEVRIHDDPGAPDAQEESGHRVPEDQEDRAEDEHAEIRVAEPGLQRRMSRQKKEPPGERREREQHRIAGQGQQQRLERRRGALILPAGTVVLRDDRVPVSHGSDEEGREHERGESAAHRCRKVLLSQPGEEQAVDEEHEGIGGLGNHHRKGDGKEPGHGRSLRCFHG